MMNILFAHNGCDCIYIMNGSKKKTPNFSRPTEIRCGTRPQVTTNDLRNAGLDSLDKFQPLRPGILHKVCSTRT